MDNISPAEKVSALRKLRENIRALPAFRQDPVAATWLERFLLAQVDAVAVPLVFRYLGADDRGRDRFEVGRSGQELRVFVTGVKATWWAWKAIDDAGKTSTLRAVDMAGVDTSDPNHAAGKALRQDAAEVLARRSPELAQACSFIRVLDGVISYDPPLNAVKIITK